MHRDADCFIHLGDGAAGFCELCAGEGVFSLAVRGNCDFAPCGEIPAEIVHTFDDYRFFLTHGNKYGVSFSKYPLADAARKKNCDIALFGHTHVAYCEYLPGEGENEKGVYLFNPGSLCVPRDGQRSYGVIIIRSGQILLNNAKLDDRQDD